MSTLPLVSVVMPSFNQARFIGYAIHSVLEQDYANLELIVADGGSSDGTLEILSQLRAYFGSRLIWYSEPDTGSANAINKALCQAKGDIIGWLNSDDCYAPGSISRAVLVFQGSTETVMVYGEGEHIDEHGNFISRYPTKPPASSLEAFQAGCYLCQPTVFLKQFVLTQVGLLDESLKTAFDFEWWLRIFKTYPDKIAYISEVQAYSRLHANCITMRQRRLVALEGMEVLCRHTGAALSHWLMTYFEELCSTYPHGESPLDLRQHMLETLAAATSFLTPDSVKQFGIQLKEDKRWQLAQPNVFAGIYADGWSSQHCIVRLRVPVHPTSLELYCENAQPDSCIIHLTITNSWNQHKITYHYARKYFLIKLEIPFLSDLRDAYICINSAPFFIPQNVEPHSLDLRKLTFKINRILLLDNF